MKQSLKIFVLACTCTALLSGCAGFFDKDNTPPPAPLVKFTPQATPALLWHAHPNGGSHKEYLKLVPAYYGTQIFTADHNGTVSATDNRSGKVLWKIRTGVNLTAGPTAREGLVVVGSQEGDLIALRATDGSVVWKNKASSEIFAPAAIGNGIVLVKAIDGKLSAFAAADGRVRWQYQQTEPNLILRNASVPQIVHDTVIVGFANGNLAKLTLLGGNLLWERPLATAEGSFAIQRMIDIDVDPMVQNDHIYAATYQGKIVAVDFNEGQIIWSHDISSYTGLTVDQQHVYVSDANSRLWAFNKRTGQIDWQQSELLSRNITGPVLMDNTLVVGDGAGYLHWLSRQDGHLIARTRVNSAGIWAAPIVVNHVLYVLSKDGQLAAYRLGQ